MKGHGNVDVLTFLGGIALFVVGLFWFLSSVTVTTGFFRSGSLNTGLVVVPFLIGVVLLFFNFRSLPGRVLSVLGFLVIVASVVMSTRLYFRPTSLYAYVLMLVCVGGGAGLLIKALWGGKKK